MKKLILTLFVLALATSSSAQDSFFGDLIVSEEVQQEKDMQTGQSEASKILNMAPKKVELDKYEAHKSNLQRHENKSAFWEPAPFGLKWLAPIKEIRALHVRLQQVEVKDAPNTYAVHNLPKPVNAFRDVLISFGYNNSLWRIAAYGKFIKDDSSASKGVAEYKKYYNLLSEKYGNAQEFYSPAIENVEEVVPHDDGTSTTSLKQRAIEIGDVGFLKKLMSGEATLYATFENETIGVTLALLADGEGQTYIIVDYKNLTATKRENEDLYDAL